MADAVMKISGQGCELEVFAEKVAITPRGVLGMMNRGLKGTKTIPFASITAVQHKKVGLTTGYLQFSIKGGTESKGGVIAAQQDENTFVYSKKSDEALVEQAKAYVEARIGAGPSPQLPAVDVAAQIEQLAALKERGILTDDEFTAKKRQLLGL